MNIVIPKWLEPVERSWPVRYTVAAVLVILSTIFRMVFEQPFHSLVFFTYFPALAVAGWFGGFGPGFFATVLSAVAVDYFWMEPRHTFALTPSSALQLTVFTVFGSVISILNEVLHHLVRRERSLRQEFEVTLSSIGDGVIATNEHGSVTFLNPAAAALTGWSPEEAQGQPLSRVFDIVNEETRQAVANPVEKVLREKKVAGLANHTVLISKDRKEIPIEDSAAPIQTTTGTLVGAVLVFQDATERRRAQEAQERLAAVIQSSEDAIITETLEGIITSWNNGAERIFGYSAAEMIGAPISILFPKDRPNEEVALLTRIVQGERIEHYQTTRVRKDGTTLSISLGLAALRNQYGKIVGASKIARDITAQKTIEEQLRQRTRRLDLATATAGLGVFDWNLREDRAIWENTRMYEIFGMSPSEPPLSRKALEEQVIHREDAPRFHARLDHALKTHEPFRELCRIRRKSDGSLRTLQFSAQFEPTMDETDRLVGVVADVTEQHAATEHLEHTVAERTASLRETITQLEEFSYSVSHDLRSPLRTMQGYASALLEDYGDKLDSDGKHFLQQIAAASQRMDRLTQDVLAYSKLSHAKAPTQLVDLSILVPQIIDQYPNLSASRAGIVIDQPLAKVRGNEALLTQAISNLIGNALKFVREGVSPEVRISTEVTGDKVRLWIADNGIGIDPGYQDRIFGIFEQIHPRGQYGGTGIGLAIVRRAVERCGGRVGVESDGKTGSRFWIELSAE